MSEAFQDAKDAIIDGVFKFIDRMNDLCDTGNAERVVSEFTKHMDPLIEEYLELKFAPAMQHQRLQLCLEFRTPEEIEAAEQTRKSRLRPVTIVTDL